ncbi:hypothetical protein PTRA_a2688 [Pseudoalteromonas translucida KMM 520]|uniref:Uncharacterized protein n=1 Tax=Pseudoalteromonas translucida KMM 520 TaxID=1315283 RepID=A0A0U2X1D2_9GAMM|nr:hypothetical protein PTRA_a2688 [Pseudoalteromonas translucida KMM 520]
MIVTYMYKLISKIAHYHFYRNKYNNSHQHKHAVNKLNSRYNVIDINYNSSQNK